MNYTKEQLDAINKEGQNIIVSASAGSGKTTVLAERVIRKLKKGISLNELLILTFTNLAAKEMKEKIRKSLKENKDLENELKLIDSAQITTFDSFALSLVKKYSYKLNIDSNIKISESSLVILEKQKIIDDIFDELYLKKEASFFKLIEDFCIKDDIELKKNIIKVNDKLELKYDKINYLKKYLKDYYSKENINFLINSYKKLVNNLQQRLKKFYEELKLYVESSYIDKIDNKITNIINANNLSLINSYSNIKLDRLPPKSTEEAKTLKEKMVKIIDSIYEYSNKSEKDLEKELLTTKDYASVIIDILLKLDQKINSYKIKNNIFEFTDIAKLAIKLSNEDHEVKNELKYNYKEIMIDEYQDTNDLQEMFINAIANNNLYMVGDIKQSIYKFRNANVDIFKDKYEKYSKSIDGIKIDLNKNFRSRNEVINNINLIFNSLMSFELGGADYKLNHQMVFGNTMYDLHKKEDNNIEIFNYTTIPNNNFKKEEIEIFIIVKDIIEKINNKYLVYDNLVKKLRPIEYGDFTIICDRLTISSLYEKIFEYFNIPLVVYKDITISKTVIFNLIKNILNLLIKIGEDNQDEEEKFLFLSVARSFLFEEKDDYLFDVISKNLYKESFIYQKFVNINHEIKNKTIYEILKIIIEKLNIYDNLIKIGDVENNMININYLLNLSIDLANIGYNLKDFYNYLTNIDKKEIELKYSKSKQEETKVKLMTIHASKGLEYNVCYYNLLFKDFNLKDVYEKITFDNDLGIVLPYFDNQLENSFVKEILKEKYEEEQISEKIRLLYVALTRSKEKIILITNDIYEKLNTYKFRNYRQILMSLINNLDKYVKNVDLEKLNLTKKYNEKKENKITKENINILKVEEINIENNIIETKQFSKKENDLLEEKKLINMKKGNELHHILETINLKNPNYELIKDNFLLKKIKAFINSPLLKEINNAKVYQEYEFIYEKDNIKRHGFIDLMLEYENNIEIIDYKMKNIDNKEYINQLKGYQEYIFNLTKKKVNIYLYSLLDENFKKIN